MSTWALAALGVAGLIGVVIAAGLALDDPAVLDAIERDGAAIRRGWDRLATAIAPARKWAARETAPARAWLGPLFAAALAYVLALVSIVVYAWTTSRRAYRRREGRHYSPARVAADYRPPAATAGTHARHAYA